MVRQVVAETSNNISLRPSPLLHPGLFCSISPVAALIAGFCVG